MNAGNDNTLPVPPRIQRAAIDTWFVIWSVVYPPEARQDFEARRDWQKIQERSARSGKMRYAPPAKASAANLKSWGASFLRRAGQISFHIGTGKFECLELKREMSPLRNPAGTERIVSVYASYAPTVCEDPIL